VIPGGSHANIPSSDSTRTAHAKVPREGSKPRVPGECVLVGFEYGRVGLFGGIASPVGQADTKQHQRSAQQEGTR
jgi:hypothetical protein